MTQPDKDSSLRIWLRFRLAQLVTLLGRDGEAIDLLESVAAESPAYAPAWRHLGFLHAKRGRDEKAVEALSQALAVAPDDDATRFNLGFLLHRLRRIDEAIGQYEQVVRTSPRNDRAWYGLGLCLCEKGLWEAAVAPLKEAATLQYFNPHAGHQLCRAYHQLGRTDALRAEYERIKSFEPKFAAQIRSETGIAD
jgi:tetratricopeptide (TPR) repeat protein